jgi:hypothetical protein
VTIDPRGIYCRATALVDQNDGILVCTLPPGHGGDLHYDEYDDVSWKAGAP